MGKRARESQDVQLEVKACWKDVDGFSHVAECTSYCMCIAFVHRTATLPDKRQKP